MKIISSILLFVYLSLPVKNEWKDFVHFFSQENINIEQIDKFIDNCPEHSIIEKRKEKTKISLELEVDRFLFNSYQQRIFSIQKTTRGVNYNLYYLNLITKNQEIISLSLIGEDEQKFLVNQIREGYPEMLSEYDSKRDIESDWNHYYYNPKKLMIVAFGCGLSQYSSKLVDYMNDLVDEKDKDEIIKMCYSFNPEVRCVGAIGLLYLEMRKVVLGGLEKTLLEELMKDETPIYICEGCTERGQVSTVGKRIFREIEMIKIMYD